MYLRVADGTVFFCSSKEEFLIHRSYHLPSLKNCFMSNVFIWLGNSVSFSIGFHQVLSNRESKEVASVLSLIESFDFRLERRNVRVWCPNPTGFLL